MAKKTRTAKKAVGKSSPAKKPKKAKPPAPAVPFTRETVAQRAYEIWLKKNHVAHSNHPVQNWLDAEAELRGKSGK